MTRNAASTSATLKTLTILVAMLVSPAAANPTKEARDMGAARLNPPGTSWTEADANSVFTPAGFQKPGVAVHATGQNTGHLKIVVRDEKTGKPTFCRVNVVGPDGNYYQPDENKLTEYSLIEDYTTAHKNKMPRGNRPAGPIRYYGRYFYCPGETSVDVPAGDVRIEVWKGFEYQPETFATRLEAGQTLPAEITLKHTMPMSEFGYYSGDPHVHILRQTPADDETILDLMEAEDIRFSTILAFNLPPGTYDGIMEKQWTPQYRGLGSSSLRTRGDYHIVSGQEYRTSTFGHLNLFMRNGMVLPGQTIKSDDWPLYGEVGKETQKLGGYAFYAHGGFAQSIYADFVQGNVNGVELLQFAVYFGIGLDSWYDILNIGYRFPATGACDWPYARALGDSKTFVQVDGKPDFAKWLQGAAEGRSFFSTGPMLLLEVDGQKPGARISKSGNGPHLVTARIRVRSEVSPVNFVQLIVNGKAVEELAVPTDQRMRDWITLQYPVKLTESSWIAARAYAKTATGAPDSEAHTNPVYVYINGKAPYNRESLDRLVASIDLQIKFHKGRTFDKKTDVLAYFERSRDILMAIRAAGGVPAEGNPFDIAKDDHALLRNSGAQLHSDDELKEFLKPISSRTPEESQKTMETLAGFRMDLVAHEPLVCDPVAAEFDENGQLYVCEMIDYPYRPKSGEKPLGRIRLLRDTNGDGVFDESHVFADGLLWASGVVPWKGGVFVASAPDIWYLKDTDGDFKADVRTKIFTGFGTQNQQAMLNNLRYGLDHLVYGSTGPNGGKVHAADESESKSISVTGHDFRFDPQTHRFDTISGTVQFGNSFDDWGNRFLCLQSRPLFQEVLPQRYLARNPYLPVATAIKNLTEDGPVPIFRISPTERWRQIRSNRLIANQLRDASQSDISQYTIDAAAGVTVYRGAAFPKEFYGNVFIGEAQNNLVHRRVLVPDGSTFTSRRADENTEFVRSSDNWFRPVNFVNAPDGTLLVLDMSREIIESNNIPLDVAKHLDLKRGRDQGRIYRLTPKGFKAPPPPQLGRASTAEVVAALENPNGWWRDTAHRLIHERQDKSCVPALRSLLDKSAVPQARLLALWSLKGLDELSDTDIERALSDPAPEIREHAIRLAESRLEASPAILNRVLSQGEDRNPRICFQLAFTLGETKDPRAIAVLGKIASGNASNKWIRAAVLSSVGSTADRLFNVLLADTIFADSKDGTSFLTELARIVGAHGQATEIGNIIEALSGQEKRETLNALQEAVVLGLGSGTKGTGNSLPEPDALPPASATLLRSMMARAEATATDGERSPKERAQSVKLLGCRQFEQVQPTLTRLMAPSEPQDVQLATLDVLAEFKNSAIGPLVISGLKEYSPAASARAIRLLLSRKEWTESYLAAIEEGHVSNAQIDMAARTKLLEHRDDTIRSAAQKLFSNSPRKTVIANYRSVLQHPGDPSRGELVFKRECAGCHKVHNEGFDVGPDLASSPSRDIDALLTNILDPNRFVDPSHIQYTISDQSGRTFSGKIVAETATSVTLTSGKGVRETILRKDIDQFVSTGRSLMPEGLENTISKEEMANLLAFLNGLESAPGTVKPALVGGTRPGAVEP